MKNYFKVMLAGAMLFSVALSANAQFSKKVDKTEPDRFHMGIRGGITSNTYTVSGGSSKTLDAYVFPTGGFALDFQIAPVPVFLGFGLNYVNYGYKSSNIKGKLDGLQMPITGSYHINVAPNLFINPFAGGFIAYTFDKNDLVDKKFNYGLRVGCGLNFGRLTFDAGYDLGLANLFDKSYSDDIKVKSGTLFVTLGFNWAGSR